MSCRLPRESASSFPTPFTHSRVARVRVPLLTTRYRDLVPFPLLSIFFYFASTCTEPVLYTSTVQYQYSKLLFCQKRKKCKKISSQDGQKFKKIGASDWSLSNLTCQLSSLDKFPAKMGEDLSMVFWVRHLTLPLPSKLEFFQFFTITQATTL